MKSNFKVLVVRTEKQKMQDAFEILSSLYNEVQIASDKEAIAIARQFQPDLIFTDYSVSDMSGILFFKQLIADSQLAFIPTLFVSDSRSYDHRLNAFEMGAVDFLRRPLDVNEISQKTLVHIHNRRRIKEDRSVEMGNLRLNPVTEEVHINNEKISLTDLEFRILRCLLTSSRQIITRSEIYEQVWGRDMSSTGRLDTQLYNLKKKIQKFNGRIKSINKIGMRILSDESTFFQEPKKAELQSPPQDPRL